LKHEKLFRRFFFTIGLVAICGLFLALSFYDNGKTANTKNNAEKIDEKKRVAAQPKSTSEFSNSSVSVPESQQESDSSVINEDLVFNKNNWSYDNTVVANRLHVPHVSQIPSGILVEPESGKILWSKLSKRPMEIASMTKMMTVLLALEAVKSGRICLDDSVVVTKSAARIGGSQVFLKQGEVFSLRDLLKTVMIVSANDSAYLVAQKIGGGSVANFVKMMNERAKELGMKSTHYYNPHGLPERGGRNNKSSAYDLAVLACELLKYPEARKWAATWMDDFRNGNFKLVNHNKLIKTVPGVDGLKTGYYKRAGFCVTLTAKQNGKRLVGVIIGAKTKTLRNTFAKNLLKWSENR